MASPAAKRERIRLNQQRSRARKQEYLQDLEKRVRDCYHVRREAEIQRNAYQQTYRENQKLRAWIAMHGLTPPEIDELAIEDPEGLGNDHGNLRQIRPKVQSEWSTADLAVPSPPDHMQHLLRVPEIDPSVSSGAASSGGDTFSTSPYNSTMTVSGDSFLPFLDCDDASNTMFTYCDAFEDSCGPNIQPTMENSISCSRAREFIDQQNIAGLSLAHLGAKFACGLTGDVDHGEDCRVDRGVLFSILDNLSASCY